VFVVAFGHLSPILKLFLQKIGFKARKTHFYDIFSTFIDKKIEILSDLWYNRSELNHDNSAI